MPFAFGNCAAAAANFAELAAASSHWTEPRPVLRDSQLHQNDANDLAQGIEGIRSIRFAICVPGQDLSATAAFGTDGAVEHWRLPNMKEDDRKSNAALEH